MSPLLDSLPIAAEFQLTELGHFGMGMLGFLMVWPSILDDRFV